MPSRRGLGLRLGPSSKSYGGNVIVEPEVGIQNGTMPGPDWLRARFRCRAESGVVFFACDTG